MILSLLNIGIFFSLIIFAFYSWRKIETGIAAVVFCLPLYLLRLNIFGIPSTVLEFGIYILFIIWLIKNHYRIKLSEIIPDKLLRIGVFLLLAGAVISAVFSTDLRTSAGIFKGWFFDPFLFFIILISEIKTFRQKENILKALYFSGAAVAIIGLLHRLEVFSGGISYDNRLYSIYLSPNYLAMFLSSALIIGFWLLFSDKSKKYIWLVLLMIIAIALYFTYSYSAWLALFVSAAALFYCLFKEFSVRKKLFLFFVFCFLFISALFSQINNDRLTVLKNLAYRSSFHSRQMIWSSVWEIGKDNWLLGIGPGNFQKKYLEYQARFPEPYLEWAVPQPHNIFLAFWLETGLLGLLGFLVILAWFFKRCLNLVKIDSLYQENFLLVAVLFSLMIYTIMHGLFDTTYWKNDLAIIFWLNLALLVSIKK